MHFAVDDIVLSALCSNTAFHVNACLAGADSDDVLRLHGVPIGFLYNNKSPLENMHSNYTFIAAKRSGCDVFARARASGDYKEMRSSIVEEILATDMQSHTEQMAKLRDMGAGEDISYEHASTRSFVLQLVVHIADLGNTAFPWAECYKWGRMCGLEMFAQTKRRVIAPALCTVRHVRMQCN
eukprot:SAG31_NODE_6762_length_1895_cov_1.335746_1_plen_182_part_00